MAALPLNILPFLALPLFSPLLRRLFSSGRSRSLATVLPVALFLLWVLARILSLPASSPVIAGGLSREGLLLCLCLGAVLLPLLLVLTEKAESPKGGRLPAVWFPCLLLSAGSAAFLESGDSGVLAGGGLLGLLLLGGAGFLGGAYPGAYRNGFLLRVLAGSLLVLTLSFRATLVATPAGGGMLLAAILLFFPAPLSRRSERVVAPEFLQLDMLFFLCLPPLLVFDLLRVWPSRGFPDTTLLEGIVLGWGLLGLVRAKTAHYVQEVADGLSSAGMGAMVAGLLTGTAAGREGGLFLAVLLPQASLLGGLVLSALIARFRVRTVSGLSGAGAMIAPLRLAFLLAAFQGMSLPVVGGLLGEWRLIEGIYDGSPLLGIGVLAGLFLTFALTLAALRRFFSGMEPPLSRGDREIVKTLWPGELWAFGTASFLLLLTDFAGTLGWFGGAGR